METKIGANIQALRLKQGLSQEAFGALLGTTRQTVSKWELNQSLPELSKVIAMSEQFGITTDVILRGTETLLPSAPQPYVGGVWRGKDCEICETEKYALYLYIKDGGACFGMQLYAANTGHSENTVHADDAVQKFCIAVCEHDRTTGTTHYAFRSPNGTITDNHQLLIPLLGKAWNPDLKTELTRTEAFFCSPYTGKTPLPGVSESGIEKCLYLWRMSSSCSADAQHFKLVLCTEQTEYVLSIVPEDTNIYCGASCNYPFALGMMAGGQYFRIRAYKDNSAPFCSFHADFSCLPRRPQIPFDELILGACINGRNGLVWCIKRYNEDEIVLQGCGDDEYIYTRYGKRDEVLSFSKKFNVCSFL